MTLSEKALVQVWRIPLGPSYSGPVLSRDLVYTTENKNKSVETVLALDRKTGKVRWRAEWPGSMSVPFFAKSNGDWIRSTPAFDGTDLFVAGMCDVLVSLNGITGKENWRLDFVKQFKTQTPAFGFVCSPLVDGEAVYVQAASSVVKVNKRSGAVIWRALQEPDGMMSSAFSSPLLVQFAGRKQLIVQTRSQLAGLDPESGQVLWSQVVPAFRGMNILTPVVLGDAIFTSSYQNKSWLYRVTESNGKFTVNEAWSAKAQGYMSTPIVIDGHAYLHLQNQRFTCLNLTDGAQTWITKPFGKYWSMIAQGDRILALDQRGTLLLIKANPKEFTLLDQRKIADEETWAHLAVSDDELFIRELNGLSVYRWKMP
jgi:outer membrane protein assembly factor BamB